MKAFQHYTKHNDILDAQATFNSLATQEGFIGGKVQRNAKYGDNCFTAQIFFECDQDLPYGILNDCAELRVVLIKEGLKPSVGIGNPHTVLDYNSEVKLQEAEPAKECNTSQPTEKEPMNTQQVASLNSARTADRKSQIATLKLLRSQGIDVLVKLNASARAIADEVARLLKVATTVVKCVVSKAATDVKATLTYWQARPIKPLNTRAVGGAIALSLKLGF